MSKENADTAMIEAIAEAVVRKIDERDKINLLAEAVIARLQRLGQAPAAADRSRAERAVTRKEGEI